MRAAKSLFVSLLGCTVLASSAQAIDIILEPLSMTTHPRILDGTFTFDEEPPAGSSAAAVAQGDPGEFGDDELGVVGLCGVGEQGADEPARVRHLIGVPGEQSLPGHFEGAERRLDQ